MPFVHKGNFFLFFFFVIGAAKIHMEVGDFLSLLDHKNVHHNDLFHYLIPGNLNVNQRPIFQALTTEFLHGAAQAPLVMLCTVSDITLQTIREPMKFQLSLRDHRCCPRRNLFTA